MENVEKVDTANTEKNAGVDNVKTFTQDEMNSTIQKRLARERKKWETENASEKNDDSKVFEMQKKLASYEKSLALSKYQIADEYKDYVEFKVLRGVNKDTPYQTAIDNFFADESNQRFLQQAEKVSMPKVKNTSGNDKIAMETQAIRKAMGLK